MIQTIAIAPTTNMRLLWAESAKTSVLKMQIIVSNRLTHRQGTTNRNSEGGFILRFSSFGRYTWFTEQ
jgi:hypothetical protein